ncbi:hypothetical protein OKA04_18115 [Luteolibacter flavescens]|uniref:DUF4336 domain-containing protein n=1 Tax=Luteolibacter flavescens TaxID=1859460 RepID=A0ABT3FUJ8_9BACT|nr:hypothetical protein [Luteolibacter flavescens]MCW1886660.1 hypothetical protein [Luteolibacter flavescens]
MMNELSEGLWALRYPLKVLGTSHGRTVTVIRLTSGRLVIHSMAPFTPEDLAQIRRLGEPGWLVEAMLLHDTYAKEGRACFPALPFLGPPGFGDVVGFETGPLLPAPPEWGGELEVIRLKGAPKLEEHAFLHVPSRTLIVADLVFNFPADEGPWNHFFHRHLAGMKRYPGMSRVFRWCIRDRAAFRESLSEMMKWDFDRIIPGHGEIIETGGKEGLARALEDAGVI